MNLASQILEKKSNLEKTDEKKGEMSPVMKMIEKLKKENFSKDNDSQMEAMGMMKKLAESDDKMANAFMKHIDEAASKYDGKMSEKKDEDSDEEDDSEESEDDKDEKKKK